MASRIGPTRDQLRQFYDLYAMHGMSYALQQWNEQHKELPVGRSQAYKWVEKHQKGREATLLLNPDEQILRLAWSLEICRSWNAQGIDNGTVSVDKGTREIRGIIMDFAKLLGMLPRNEDGQIEVTLSGQIRAELDELRTLALQEADDTIAAIQPPQRRKDAS